MNQDTKNILSKMQQAIWALEKAQVLLDEIDGMGDYVDHVNQAIEDIEQEMDELASVDN